MERLEKTDLIILGTTISVGLLISILSLTGLLDNIVWLKEKIPSITLLLVTLVATSLLVGTYNTKQFLESLLPRKMTTKIGDSGETIQYTIDRIKKAKKRVCDLSMERFSRRSSFNGDKHYEAYLKMIIDLSKKQNFKYSEIMLFSGIWWVRKAEKLVNNTGDSYELAVYPNQPESSPPIRNFVLVDDEVILLKYGLSVKEPEIVGYFSEYYNSLWDSAIPIKTGTYLEPEMINKIAESIKKD